jgi:inorganic pyrophosphatase
MSSPRTWLVAAALLLGAVLWGPRVLHSVELPETDQPAPPAMQSLLHVSPGDKAPDEVQMIVEIPRGSQNKYEYDPRQRVIKLDRVLASPFHYPGEYGFVPRTRNADGDPLDVLVLVTAATYPGTMIVVRPVGVLQKVDTGDQDDLILAVPVKDPRFAGVRDLADVAEPVRQEIAHFFAQYKALEGKQVTINGWQDAAHARATISRCLQAFAAPPPR